MENGSVIETLKFAFINEKRSPIDNPKWNEVEDALMLLGNIEKGGYISLRDFDDTRSMIIFGESGIYHIGIVTEDDENYVYCNGSAEVEVAEVPISGNYFKEHQICRDFEILKTVVKYFYKTGLPSEDVIWES